MEEETLVALKRHTDSDFCIRHACLLRFFFFLSDVVNYLNCSKAVALPLSSPTFLVR